MRARLGRNVAANMVNAAATIGASLISLPFILHHIGTAGYGGPPGLSIPRYTAQFWVVATASGRTRKPLRAIQVYLFDTGPGRLLGSAWIDGASLVSGDGLVSFPPPR